MERPSLDEALGRAFERGVEVIFGISTPKAPESYDELVEYVNASRNDSCNVSREIDEFMGMIALFADRDQLVRSLPYDEKDHATVFLFDDPAG